MSEITLSNFADLLDPDQIDKGRNLYNSGVIVDFSQNGDITKAVFEEKKQKTTTTITIPRKEVSLIHCSCAAHLTEGWDDDPCVHAVALLFVLKNGMPEIQAKILKKTGKVNSTEKAKKILTEKAPKKRKNSTDDLLFSLEKNELQAFLQEVMAQNKEIKSQFMLYFASNTVPDYNTLIEETIKSIKGRRRYIAAAEAGRIVVALSSLFKKAADAEAKGYFSDALTIIRPLLSKLNETTDFIENNSVKFNRFVENCFDLRIQIAQNTALPDALKQEEFRLIHADYSGDKISQVYWGKKAYEAFFAIAKSTNQIAIVADVLEEKIRNASRMYYVYTWHYQYRLKLLRDLYVVYQEHLKDASKAEKVFHENRDLLPIILDLVEINIWKGEIQTAKDYFREIKKTDKVYRSQLYEDRNSVVRFDALTIKINEL